MNFLQCIRQYESDPNFATLVSFLYRAMMDNVVNPYELKDICNFAVTKFVAENPRPIPLVNDPYRFFEEYKSFESRGPKIDKKEPK